MVKRKKTIINKAMKLEQFVNEKCKVTSTFKTIDAVENSIFLMLPDSAKDEEKASAVAKVTSELVQSGWIIADTQTLDHAVAIEYTKTCDPTDVIAAMLSC